MCDDNADALAALSADGVAAIDPADAVARIADFALVVTSPGFPPDRAGAGRRGRGRGADLG